jgi:hypothetical protein
MIVSSLLLNSREEHRASYRWGVCLHSLLSLLRVIQGKERARDIFSGSHGVRRCPSIQQQDDKILLQV